MSPIGESVKVLSANYQGLRNREKRSDVLRYFKEKNAAIVCLQDTHLTANDINTVKEVWNECYVHGSKTNARGVAVLLNDNFEHKLLEYNTDRHGNHVQMLIMCSSTKINLINIYAPNQDDPTFFHNIKAVANNVESDYIMICGDFNLVMDPVLDSFNYRNINNPRARMEVHAMVNELDLTDAYRYSHPSTKRYTWRRKPPLKQARLDYFLVSSPFIDLIGQCDINSSYRSDHSILELSIVMNPFTKGKGIWRFNNSLLYDKDYLNLVNTIIDEEKVKYAVHIQHRTCQKFRQSTLHS